MAGFFGLFDFTKPGKGIEKDAPEKHPFFLFFELVWRKFGRLILLNLMYFVAVLPMLAAFYYVYYNILLGMLSNTGADLSQMGPNFLPGMIFEVSSMLPDVVKYLLLAASVFFYGPVTCGLTFMLRNFARQQHAWNSDFFDKIKQNFKQGLVLGLMDVAIICLFFFNVTIRPASGSSASSIITVAQYVSVGLLIIYLFMRNYLFIMAVTFDIKVRQIFKNAWIFAVIGLWRNALVLVVNALIMFFTLLFSLAELALVPLLLFSLTGFVSVFTCYPVIKKHMIDPQTKASEEKGALPEVEER